MIRVTLVKVIVAMPVFAAGLAWSKTGAVSVEAMLQVWPATLMFGGLYGAFDLWTNRRKREKAE